jgi:uncharacterized protein (DUF433 family)
VSAAGIRRVAKHGAGPGKLPAEIWIPVGEFRSLKGMSREVRASYRYIVRSPEVRDGHARVNGTRVAVHDVIGLLQTGGDGGQRDQQLHAHADTAQVYERLAYYEHHRGEIDLLVTRQMAKAHEQL